MPLGRNSRANGSCTSSPRRRPAACLPLSFLSHRGFSCARWGAVLLERQGGKTRTYSLSHGQGSGEECWGSQAQAEPRPPGKPRASFCLRRAVCVGVPQLQLSEVLLKDPSIRMLSADQNCVTLTPAVCHAVLRYMGQKPLGGWYLVSGYWRGQAHTNLSKKATELYNNQACE